MSAILLYGDSLTVGRIGIAFRRYLPFPTEAHGIEGETWAGSAVRAIGKLKRSHGIGRQTLMLQSGANDLLIPYMLAHHPKWAERGRNLISKHTPPIPDDGRFLPVFKELMQELLDASDTVRIILCAIVPLGEDLGSPLNEARRNRNEMMRTHARSYERTVWCDIATPLEQRIRDVSTGQNPYLPDDPMQLDRDARLVGADERKASLLATGRNLAVTIDGIHPNPSGAKVIAEHIVATISS